jgi:hypothetical protein
MFDRFKLAIISVSWVHNAEVVLFEFVYIDMASWQHKRKNPLPWKQNSTYFEILKNMWGFAIPENEN